MNRRRGASLKAPTRPGPPVLSAGHAHIHPYPGFHARLPLQRILLEALLLAVVSAIVFGYVAAHGASLSSFSSSRVDSYGINAGGEPVQTAASPLQASLTDADGVADLTSDTGYSISAKVESVHGYQDSVSGTIPYDLLLAWGKMATPEVDGRLSWQQGGRQGVVSGTLGGAGGADVSNDYLVSHVSNNHLIPDDDAIRTALATIRPGDLVRIDGRLVDVRVWTADGRILTMSTSKSRTDQGDGACEIILVQRIKINANSFT